MRRRAGALLVILAVLVAPGCSKEDDAKDELLSAVRRTAREPRTFIYRETRPAGVINTDVRARSLQVEGLVEDDFRFQARVTEDERPAFDEIVSDDTLAMRFLEPARIDGLVNDKVLAKADVTSSIENVSSVDVLRSRRWVVDEDAAPVVTQSVRHADDLGKDPVLDAVTALAYVEDAVRSAVNVQKWRKEAVTPAYSRSEDTFPKPEVGASVVRYDLVRPKLPPPSQQLADRTAGGGRPQTRHFRRMAVYVKDGMVIQVREETDVRGKFQRDLIKYFRTFAKESGLAPEVIAGFDESVKTAPEEQLRIGLIEALNVGLRSSGDDPILVRSMTLEIRRDRSEREVAVPTENAVRGGLDFMVTSGKGRPDPRDKSAAPAPASTTTTTSSTVPAS